MLTKFNFFEYQKIKKLQKLKTISNWKKIQNLCNTHFSNLLVVSTSVLQTKIAHLEAYFSVWPLVNRLCNLIFYLRDKFFKNIF